MHYNFFSIDIPFLFKTINLKVTKECIEDP